MFLRIKSIKNSFIIVSIMMISAQAMAQISQPSSDDIMLLYLKETGQLRIALAEARSEAISLKKQLEELKKNSKNEK